jgi:hypothetical protein
MLWRMAARTGAAGEITKKAPMSMARTGFAVLSRLVEIWRAGRNKTANTCLIEIAL